MDDFDFSKWDTLDQILPSGMKAVLLLGKIYTTVWMFMGAETFFNALEKDEELVSAMFEKVGKVQYETFLRVAEHPCVGAVLNPDDIAHNTGLLIHPKYLKKYVFSRKNHVFSFPTSTFLVLLKAFYQFWPFFKISQQSF